jgi:hypothetical protein
LCAPDPLPIICGAANHDGNLTAHEQMEAARAQQRSLPEMSEVYRDIDHQANELRMANIARRRRTSHEATDAVVEPADAAQFDLGQGPCLTAWAAQKMVLMDDVAEGERWPHWCRAVSSLPSAPS